MASFVQSTASSQSQVAGMALGEDDDFAKSLKRHKRLEERPTGRQCEQTWLELEEIGHMLNLWQSI